MNIEYFEPKIGENVADYMLSHWRDQRFQVVSDEDSSDFRVEFVSDNNGNYTGPNGYGCIPVFTRIPA